MQMLSYEVPLHYGLLDKATLMDQRYSNTMSEDSFARESLSIWTRFLVHSTVMWS